MSRTTATYIVIKPGMTRGADGKKAKTVGARVKMGGEIALTKREAGDLVGKVRLKSEHDKEISGAGAQLDALEKELKDAVKALDVATQAKLEAEKDRSELQDALKSVTTERDTLAAEVKKLNSGPKPPGAS